MAVGIGFVVYGITLDHPCQYAGCPVPPDPVPFLAIGAFLFILSLSILALSSRKSRIPQGGAVN
jgi:hypothetical protein